MGSVAGRKGELGSAEGSSIVRKPGEHELLSMI